MANHCIANFDTLLTSKNMAIKYTNHFLRKLEGLIAETGYILRYEKGQFRSGYCLLKDTHVAVVNKFFPLEGRINSIVDIINEIAIEPGKLSAASKKTWQEVASELKDREKAE